MKKVLFSAGILAAITIGTLTAQGGHHSSIINKGHYQDTITRDSTKKDKPKKEKGKKDTTGSSQDTIKRNPIKKW